jgi:hypothetical protein
MREIVVQSPATSNSAPQSFSTSPRNCDSRSSHPQARKKWTIRVISRVGGRRIVDRRRRRRIIGHSRGKISRRWCRGIVRRRCGRGVVRRGRRRCVVGSCRNGRVSSRGRWGVVRRSRCRIGNSGWLVRHSRDTATISLDYAGPCRKRHNCYEPSEPSHRSAPFNFGEKPGFSGEMPAVALIESRPNNQCSGEMQLVGQIFTTGREMVFNARKQ